MIPTQSLSVFSLIALTGQTEGMVFSLKELILFMLVSDVALLALVLGAFVGVFAALSLREKEDE